MFASPRVTGVLSRIVIRCATKIACFRVANFVWSCNQRSRQISVNNRMFLCMFGRSLLFWSLHCQTATYRCPRETYRRACTPEPAGTGGPRISSARISYVHSSKIISFQNSFSAAWSRRWRIVGEKGNSCIFLRCIEKHFVTKRFNNIPFPLNKQSNVTDIRMGNHRFLTIRRNCSMNLLFQICVVQ